MYNETSNIQNQTFNSTKNDASADLTSNPIAINISLKPDEAEFTLVIFKNKRNKSKKKN
ncbi:5480_t:CDS:2 [Cetraspora pellucida]|uniref:5480_t:CDS:1 n=1 Tax=Cetraspora pellucida TaxID=1433469 RepID=A0A9N9GZW7_9GLOM|nr:5480_t:CDS:2 [Cetraspora pellucida]